jgi:sulfonate transport system substrate-binding protein
MRVRWVTTLLLLALVLPALGVAALRSTDVAAQDPPDRIRLDYAYYNPSSLVLRHFGWLEETFAEEGIEIEWVWSAGSNKANEFLRSDAIDFGSTAGAAALLARANGSDIHTVYVYSKPEWTALVIPEGSEITSVEELEGKQIAATKGTDPYFFLLQALDEVGLTANDVEIVNVQHADGRTALENGDVDAWSGLDPYMAQTQLESGSTLLYRNIDFNSYGFLNARADFLNEYPEYVTEILAQYERARQWILENPAEAAEILANEADLSIEVAELELEERTVLDNDPVPGEIHTAVLERIIPIFVADNQLQPGADAEESLQELYAPQFIEEVLAGTAE